MYKSLILNSSVLDKLGEPTVSLYASYNDKLSDYTLKEILNNEDPEAEFIDKITELYEFDIAQKQKDVRDEILSQSEHDLSDDEIEALWDEILETLEFNLPVEHFEKQEVCVNLFLDTGDGNYDFWPNASHVPHYAGSLDPMNETASILWLTKQQGYTEEQLYQALESEHGPDPKTFLGSIRQEIENASCSMLALTFLVKMTFGQLLELNQLLRENAKGSLVIDKSCTIGLYDWSSGGGGVLDIRPDKDVEIPFDFIYAPMFPDGLDGWASIANCYGICTSLWTKAIKEVKETKEPETTD